jgi:thienamycin biosynthesis protein ThnN
MTSALKRVDEEFLAHVVNVHLHPDQGTPYWVRRDEDLGIKAYDRVTTMESFKQRLGFRNVDEQKRFEEDTRCLPLETFIPRSILGSDRTIWASQTGGTTGAPKHGNWDNAYWKHVLEFSDEFLDLHAVPRHVNWLFIGPTGPHTTGRLVISIAERRGGRCFAIDLDPRIVKIFGSEGMQEAHDRYLRHIWDQVEAILRYQKISVMFCTSRLLEMAPEYIDLTLFKSVRAVVHAGTAMGRDTNQLLREDYFPGRPIVGMYGTSTTGISWQKPFEDDDEFRVIYVPSSPFIVLEIVDEAGDVVPYRSEGHVATYRLTEDSLIPGFWERDRGTRIQPYGRWAKRYPWDWVDNIYSPAFTVDGQFEGVY